MDDSVDTAILAEVSRDPRATLAQLSERVGLGVSAVQARLRRLESTGVIAGYRAILDPEAVGRSLSAFIEITPLDPSQPDNAPELLEHLSAIEACHSIAGDAAYILFVRVATPRDLEALIRDIRLAASVSTRTTVVLQTFYAPRRVRRTQVTDEAGCRGSVVLREPEVQTAVRRVEPPGGHGLLLREEVEPVRAVGLGVAEQ
jgi:Lrp/AsnC family leucine-responsive transcriptional regulator